MRALPVLLSLVLASCNEPKPPATRPAPPPAANAPSFRAEIAPAFERSCVSARGCHGDAPTDAVALDLRPATAYADLVGKPAEMRRGGLRVKPRDPSASLLVAKLAGTLQHGEGKAMPLDPRTGWPANPSPLGPDFVSRVLTPWIAAGAPNN